MYTNTSSIAAEHLLEDSGRQTVSFGPIVAVQPFMDTNFKMHQTAQNLTKSVRLFDKYLQTKFFSKENFCILAIYGINVVGHLFLFVHKW